MAQELSRKPFDFPYTLSLSTYLCTALVVFLPPILALITYWSEVTKLRTQQPRGCKRVGILTKSNLRDEFDEKYTHAADPERWTVKSMWIFPVKSCHGVELEEATVIPAGMKYDRLFTFAQLRSPFPVAVDTPDEEKAAHKWVFITQREFPHLAKIHAQVWVPDPCAKTYNSTEEDIRSGGVMILTYPYLGSGWKGVVSSWVASIMGATLQRHLKLPLDPTLAQTKRAGYSNDPITIWKDTITALNMEVEIPQDLRLFIGTSNKLGLFRIDESKLREVHRCAPTKEELGYQPITGFQDAYPLHLLNLHSVRDLESRSPQDVSATQFSIDRFRANIIISGPGPYHEDSWKRVQIGEFGFDVSCRTARCKMPNVDQTTGQKHLKEPDRTLRKHRSVDEGAGANVGCLGMQMVPLVQQSLLRVGDKVTVLTTGQHFYIKQ